MDSIIKNAKKVAVVIRPRLAAVITFNFVEMTIETPAAWEIIKEDYFDNAFEQTKVEYKSLLLSSHLRRLRILRMYLLRIQRIPISMIFT